LFAFTLQQRGVEPGVDVTHGQMQGFEDQECGFINNAGGAVAVHQFGGAKAGDGVAQEVAGGGEFGGHVGACRAAKNIRQR
jgi:hypothetical protein